MINIFEIGMKMEIYENRLFSIRNDLKKELSRVIVDWEKVHKLSSKSLDYSKKVKEIFELKLKCIKENI